MSWTRPEFIDEQMKDCAGDFVDDFDWDATFDGLEEAGYIEWVDAGGDSGYCWSDKVDWENENLPEGFYIYDYLVPVDGKEEQE